MITSSHPIFPIPKPEFFGAFWGFPYNHHPGGVNNHPVRFRLLPFRGMAQPEMLMLFCIKHFRKKNTNESKCEEFGNVHINLLFETNLIVGKKNEPKTGWCSTTQPFFGHLVARLLSLSSPINEHTSSEITPNG